MKSKKWLLAFLMLIVLNFGYSQTYRFATTSFSVLEKNEKGKWGKWSNAEKSQVVINLDTKKNRIVIYSREVQLYRIVEYPAKQETKTSIIYPFICQDDDGLKFDITIVTRKDQGNRKQMYIYHKDVILVYNMDILEDGK